MNARAHPENFEQPQQSINRQQPEPASEPSQIASLIPDVVARKMAAARENWSLDGERRIVTILFCDLVGSTAAAGQLDPEHWAEIINLAFEHMIEPVYKYEGTVARLMGDAILAFFGAPIAHEDDPVRAVRAALEITRRFQSFSADVNATWGIEIDTRVGINTGLVLVGQVGSDLQMEYTALGDAINLASRMEQSAAPGTVQITEETRKLLPDIFESQDLGTIEVKGKSDPIHSHQIIGLKSTRGDRRRSPSLSAPLIGRKAEWAFLKNAAEANLKGVGQVVFIVGEAGLGKSRLIRELSEVCLESNEEAGVDSTGEVSWYEVSSLSYERAIPYAVIRRLLQEMISGSPSERPDSLREKLTWFDRHFSSKEMPQVRQVFDALFNLENLDGQPRLEGETFQTQLYGVMTDLLISLSKSTPLILVLDDLHWIDSASAELVIHLLDLMKTTPILILCAGRPERDSAGWQINMHAEDVFRHRYTEIFLKPLTESESERLVDVLLSVDNLPAALKNQILQRAEGNPLFVEEVVRVLKENGRVVVDEFGSHWIGSENERIEIPENIQSLLTARIDQLPEESRRVLQLAALIGRTFYYRILAVIVNQNSQTSLEQELDLLQRSAFIREAARLPELEYVFQHLLTQEAAYHTILFQHRRQYHLLVGEAMEELFSDGVVQYAARLAHHFYEGQEYSRAFAYNLMAGKDAMRLFAGAEALKNYNHALALIAAELLAVGEVDRDALLELYKNRGRAFELTYRFSNALENYQELESLAKQLKDRPLELSALVLQGTAKSIATEQYDPISAMELSEAALNLAAELNDNAAMARIYWNMMIQYRNRVMGEQALWAGEKSLALARQYNVQEQIAYTSNDLSYVYLINGQMDKAIESTKIAGGLWEELGNQPMFVDSLSALASFQMIKGDFDGALHSSDRAYELSGKIRNYWGESHSQYMMCEIHWCRGDIEKAITVVETAVSNADRVGFLIAQVFSRCEHSRILIEIGMYREALIKLDEAESKSGQMNAYLFYIAAQRAFIKFKQGDHSSNVEPFDFEGSKGPGTFAAPYCERMRATIALDMNKPDEALEILNRLESIERNYQMNTHRFSTLYHKSKAFGMLGRHQEMQETLERVLIEYSKVNARWRRWQIYADLAEISQNDTLRTDLRESAMNDINWISDHLGEGDVREAVMALFQVRGLVPVVVHRPIK